LPGIIANEATPQGDDGAAPCCLIRAFLQLGRGPLCNKIAQFGPWPLGIGLATAGSKTGTRAAAGA